MDRLWIDWRWDHWLQMSGRVPTKRRREACLMRQSKKSWEQRPYGWIWTMTLNSTTPSCKDTRMIPAERHRSGMTRRNQRQIPLSSTSELEKCCQQGTVLVRVSGNWGNETATGSWLEEQTKTQSSAPACLRLNSLWKGKRVCWKRDCGAHEHRCQFRGESNTTAGWDCWTLERWQCCW